MADVGTPDCPLAPGNPAATQSDEPALPSHQNLLRSSRWCQMIAQSGFSLNTSRGPRNQATACTTGVVTQKIALALQAFQTKYKMTSAIASTIDAFMGQYSSPEEALIAKALCKQVTEALTSTLNPFQGTTPRTTPTASNSESFHRFWAEVARIPKNPAPLVRGGANTYSATMTQKNVFCNNAGKARDPNLAWSHSEAYGSAWENRNLRSIDIYRSCTKGLQKTAYLHLGDCNVKYTKAMKC
jgi:hypothetical protein